MILSSIFAVSYELSNGVCTVDGVVQATTQPCTDGIKTVGTILGLILIPIFIVALVFLVFWILALIHAIKHEDIKDRTIWLVALIASFFLGFMWVVTIIYYFVVMRPYKKLHGQGMSASQSSQAAQPIVPQAQPQVAPNPSPVAVQPADSSDSNSTIQPPSQPSVS